MCAILDANVVHEVFGRHGTEAGKEFLYWINRGRGKLVVGGRLLQELEKGSGNFKKWARNAQATGKIRRVNREQVNARENHLREEKTCKSNDPHIIALAQVSGARLLYSNDKNLRHDFKDTKLLNGGKIYSTLQDKRFSDAHKRLLARRDLCQARS